MACQMSVAVERFPIAGAFVISRGAKTEAEVVTCTLEAGGHVGRGECVPYRRYGETIEGVVAEIEAARARVESGISRRELMQAMKPGAARNAVDCALFDLKARQTGRRAFEIAGLATPLPMVTAYTISLGSAAEMAAAAAKWSHRPLLKVKVGTDDDVPRMRAVVSAAPKSRIILDANEGWTAETLVRNLAVAAELGIALVEQPLPAGQDGMLAEIARPVPVCADESLHTVDDLPALAKRYDAVNIKLDKAGGLTAALELRDAARAHGFAIMVGCMVGTSLAMAPAVLAAQGAEFVDLDGPLLLARDRVPGLAYNDATVGVPQPELWG